MCEELVAALELVLGLLAEGLNDARTEQRVRELLALHGDLDKLQADCEAIRVWNDGNHLPLLWKPTRRKPFTKGLITSQCGRTP